MTTDDKIRDGKLLYVINTESAKRRRVIGQAKCMYSPLAKFWEKQKKEKRFEIKEKRK